MLFKWNYKPPTTEEKQAADELGAKLNISPILAQLLMQRGITTESAAKRFFHPQLADLINPFLMKDMDLAVDRLNDAMGRKDAAREIAVAAGTILNPKTARSQILGGVVFALPQGSAAARGDRLRARRPGRDRQARH